MSNNGPIITVTCSCGTIVSIRQYSYNSNIKKNGTFLCRSCKYKKIPGSYDRSNSSDLKARATKLWSDEEYATRVSSGVSSSWTNDRRVAHSNLMRSRWTKQDYRLMISSKLKDYAKNHRQLIRSIASARANLRRSQQAVISSNMWANSEYRQSVIAAINKVESTSKIIANIKRLQQCPTYTTMRRRIYDSPEYRKKLSDATKRTWQKQEYREAMALVRAQQPRESSCQLLLYEYLDCLGVNYHREGGKTAIGYYVFDCLIEHNGKKILIECQGNYWHSLPKAIRNDKAKFTYITKYFPEYEIMYVWEHEFYAKDAVLDRLKLKLGVPIESIEFDIKDAQVRSITHQTASDFLNRYHYLNKSRGGTSLGAFYRDTLIGCVVYSNLGRQNTGFTDAVELSRLCIHPSYHKKNFASWLISKSMKLITAKTIVSYADTTVGHTGTIYKAANFTLHHTVPSDYWYIDTNGYVMHKKTLYNRAVNLGMTETAFAEQHNYSKKYGGEKLCFVYHKP